MGKNQEHHQDNCCVFGMCGVHPGAGNGRRAVDILGVLRGFHSCNFDSDFKFVVVKMTWN